jgi:hypothetical protein
MQVEVTQGSPEKQRGIGTLNENPLHAALKRYLAGPGDRFEVEVDGSVIDLVRPDGSLVEIQTGTFAPLKAKLTRLLKQQRVELVHPIAVVKWLVKEDDDGQVLDRRRSPRRGVIWDCFAPLVSIPHLMAHPHFSLAVLLVELEERRRHHPGRAWRRRGWVVHERSLLSVQASHTFPTAQSLANLLPADLPHPFTTADIANALPTNRSLAQKIAYCLRAMEMIQPAGKQGNTILYEKISSSEKEDHAPPSSRLAVAPDRHL